MMTKNGSFLTQDTLQNPIILKYEVIVGKTEKLDEKIKSISSLLIPTYLAQEVQFARECNQIITPDDLKNDFMLKLLAPLFEHGKDKVDWELFEQKTKEVLENFFATVNWFQYSGEQDVNIFVTAIDQKTGKAIGIIQFLTMPAFGTNNVKIGLFGMLPEMLGRDIEQLLMSSIFKLMPDTSRLFLHNRSTNKQAIKLYENYGFTSFEGKLPHWSDFEYLTQNEDILQKKAESLIVQN